MAVNASFNDSYIGFGSGGPNALQNIAYGASWEDNHIAMGHDPQEPSPQGVSVLTTMGPVFLRSFPPAGPSLA
jgi:hypothetical protein